MKKKLKKKEKIYSNAIRYFTEELTVYGQTTIDESCWDIVTIFSCACSKQ